VRGVILLSNGKTGAMGPLRTLVCLVAAMLPARAARGPGVLRFSLAGRDGELEWASTPEAFAWEIPARCAREGVDAPSCIPVFEAFSDFFRKRDQGSDHAGDVSGGGAGDVSGGGGGGSGGSSGSSGSSSSTTSATDAAAAVPQVLEFLRLPAGRGGLLFPVLAGGGSAELLDRLSRALGVRPFTHGLLARILAPHVRHEQDRGEEKAQINDAAAAAVVAAAAAAASGSLDRGGVGALSSSVPVHARHPACSAPQRAAAVALVEENLASSECASNVLDCPMLLGQRFLFAGQASYPTFAPYL